MTETELSLPLETAKCCTRTDEHNSFERQRRRQQAQLLKDLSDLLPVSKPQPGERSPSKLHILTSARAYIEKLRWADARQQKQLKELKGRNIALREKLCEARRLKLL